MKVTDFNFRISQKFGLVYQAYDQKDSEALKLLNLLVERKIPFSFEWDDINKYSLNIHHGPILIIRTRGETVRGAITKAIGDFFLSEEHQK